MTTFKKGDRVVVSNAHEDWPFYHSTRWFRNGLRGVVEDTSLYPYERLIHVKFDRHDYNYAVVGTALSLDTTNLIENLRMAKAEVARLGKQSADLMDQLRKTNTELEQANRRVTTAEKAIEDATDPKEV